MSVKFSRSCLLSSQISLRKNQREIKNPIFHTIWKRGGGEGGAPYKVCQTMRKKEAAEFGNRHSERMAGKGVRGMIISSILPHSVDVMFDLIEGAKK